MLHVMSCHAMPCDAMLLLLSCLIIFPFHSYPVSVRQASLGCPTTPFTFTLTLTLIEDRDIRLGASRRMRNRRGVQPTKQIFR